METRHCDDYIRDKAYPLCLRMFLLYNRIPADWRYNHWRDKWGTPECYATYNPGVGPGGSKRKKYRAVRVRIVMASRFGDVGIVRGKKFGGVLLWPDFGYDTRVALSDLSDFSKEP